MRDPGHGASRIRQRPVGQRCTDAQSIRLVDRRFRSPTSSGHPYRPFAARMRWASPPFLSAIAAAAAYLSISCMRATCSDTAR